MIELDEDILDDVWQRYVRANTHADAYRMVPKHFRHASRRFGIAKNFEDWIYRDYGAVVRRRSKHCYLEVSFEEQATLFALKMI